MPPPIKCGSHRDQQMKLAVKNEESKVDELYQKIGETILPAMCRRRRRPEERRLCREIHNRKQVIDDLNEKSQRHQGWQRTGR